MSYTVVEFEAGETIFRQGDPGSIMYLVQKGEVEVLQELGGTETQVATLGRSDFFGEMSMLENAERTHTLRALCASKLVQIDRSAFSQMLHRNPDIAVRMVKKLSARLATTEDMVIRAYNSLEAAHKGVTERIVAGNARLIGLASDFEVVLPKQPEVTVGRLDPANNIHPDVDLTPIDPQISTSRRHAKIFRRADVFFIQEEQTTNGTLVHDQRISAERPIELRHDDLITFGAVRMRFVVE
jgi:CRP-like cAMP-binding protein